MSSSNLRVLAAGLTLLIAAIAGLVAAVAGGDRCVETVPSPAAATSSRPGGQDGPGPAQTDSPGQGKQGQAPGRNPTSGFTQLNPGGGAPGGGTPGGGAPEGDQLAVDGPPPVAIGAECAGRRISILSGLAAFGGALLAGAASGVLVTLAGRPGGRSMTAGPAAGPAAGQPAAAPPSSYRTAATAVVPPGPSPTGPPGTSSTDGRDRGLLVATCVYVRDRVTSQALAERLARALKDSGVETLSPVGERFDPSRHEAGGTVPTDNSSLDGTVAAVEVPGYTDRGTVLRAPVVTVYRRKR